MLSHGSETPPRRRMHASRVEREGGEVRLVVSGDLADRDVRVFDGWLRRIEADGAPSLVVDLRRVRTLDAGVLGAISAAAIRVRRSGRSLRLIDGDGAAARVVSLG